MQLQLHSFECSVLECCVCARTRVLCMRMCSSVVCAAHTWVSCGSMYLSVVCTHVLECRVCARTSVLHAFTPKC